MSKFNSRKEKESPGISTASLPDIVFMLLFFFMTVTKMRDTDMLVNVKIPQATEITKIQDKELVHYLYVGTPKDPDQFGDGVRIQANDAIILKSEIGAYILNEKAELPENKKSQAITAIKGDQKAKMGIMSDIKNKLRDVNQLKMMYYANRKKSSE